jgi:hypothetical protein
MSVIPSVTIPFRFHYKIWVTKCRPHRNISDKDHLLSLSQKNEPSSFFFSKSSRFLEKTGVGVTLA